MIRKVTSESVSSIRLILLCHSRSTGSTGSLFQCHKLFVSVVILKRAVDKNLPHIAYVICCGLPLYEIEHLWDRSDNLRSILIGNYQTQKSSISSQNNTLFRQEKYTIGKQLLHTFYNLEIYSSSLRLYTT